MKSLYKPHLERARRMKQHGVVLFIALIALVAMSLAAVALLRSVDTGTLIAGNLAFKQAATTSGDSGIEEAITWLRKTETGTKAINVYMDPSHPFNITRGADIVLGGSFTNNGYYPNFDPDLSLINVTAPKHINWTNADSKAVRPDLFGNPSPDGSGNSSRYIIQRMCRDADQPIAATDCLFSDLVMDKNSQAVRLPQQFCVGGGCPPTAQPPQMRITVRTTGPRNTVSFVQAFVF